MTRWWNEFVDVLGAGVWGGVPMLAFLSLVATTLIALGWYFWPHWLPWNWRFRSGAGAGRSGSGKGDMGRNRFRIGPLKWRLRWRWRRKKRRGQPDEADELAADELPDLPADVLTLSADQLAAAGRYKEAVRERLRAIVRDLIERELIPYSPGWTVTELANGATQSRPALAAPLRSAVNIFSEIWYGLRPAELGDDVAMRENADAIKRLLADSAVSSVVSSGVSP